MKYQPLPLHLPDQAGNTKYFCNQSPNLVFFPPFKGGGGDDKHKCVFAILTEKPVYDLVSWITLLPAEAAKIVQGTFFFFGMISTPLGKKMPGHYFSTGTNNS